MKNITTYINESKNKKEIYNIWDDVMMRDCYAKVSEQDLDDLGIYEWEGRFRYTPYGDVCDFPYFDKKELIMWMSEKSK